MVSTPASNVITSDKKQPMKKTVSFGGRQARGSLKSDSPINHNGTPSSQDGGSGEPVVDAELPPLTSCANEPFRATNKNTQGKKEEVLIDVTTEKIIYSLGETVQLEITIDNQSKKPLKEVGVALMKRASNFRSIKGQRRLASERTLKVHSEMLNPEGAVLPIAPNSTASFKGTFTIPTGLPPTTFGDPMGLNEVLYFVRVFVGSKGKEAVLLGIDIKG